MCNFIFTNTIEWSKEQIDTHNKVIPYFLYTYLKSNSIQYIDNCYPVGIKYRKRKVFNFIETRVKARQSKTKYFYVRNSATLQQKLISNDNSTATEEK